MRNMTGKSYAAALRRRLPKVGAQPCKGKSGTRPGSGESKAKNRTLSGGCPRSAARPERLGLQGSSESSQTQGCGLKLKPSGLKVLSCEDRRQATQARAGAG